jgi:hypothetical protein
VYHTEDRRVRADAESQREYSNSGEARRFAQHAQAEAQVLKQSSHAGTAISQNLRRANDTAKRKSQTNSTYSAGRMVGNQELIAKS